MNIRKKLAFPFATKELKDTGEFTGYASVFDVIDHYRDVIRKGAFLESLKDWAAKGALPPLLWQHNSALPIGPHLEMKEDDHGLWVHAHLLMDDIPEAKRAHVLLKKKVIRGMSIGFDIGDDGMEFDGKLGIWNLTKLDLWENSLVTFPANPEAQVDEVKSCLAGGKLPPPSVFEGVLRDAGFTRKQAKFITSHGYTGLRDAGLSLRDAETEEVKNANGNAGLIADLKELSNLYS